MAGAPAHKKAAAPLRVDRLAPARRAEARTAGLVAGPVAAEAHPLGAACMKAATAVACTKGAAEEEAAAAAARHPLPGLRREVRKGVRAADRAVAAAATLRQSRRADSKTGAEGSRSRASLLQFEVRWIG